jgi:hypothetical protein
MKKKSPRGIPDFSSKKPSAIPQGKMFTDNKSRPAPPSPKVKPPSTAVKSGGRRGG